MEKTWTCTRCGMRFTVTSNRSWNIENTRCAEPDCGVRFQHSIPGSGQANARVSITDETYRQLTEGAA